MDRAVRTSLGEVREGTGNLPTMHAREAVALAKDTKDAAKNGDVRSATINAAGVVANGAGFFYSGAIQGLSLIHI